MSNPLTLAKAALNAKTRNALPDSAFVFPKTREYPIQDLEHGRKALQLSGGKPENAKVKAAVYAKYPQLKPGSTSKAETVEIVKAGPIAVDSDQQIVYGVVLSPGVPDSQGDILDAVTIEKAAHGWMIEHRKQDVQHSEVAKDDKGVPFAEPVESFVAPADMELGGEPVLKGAWVLGARVNDPDTWQRVRDGEITGFSIGGSGVRTPIAES